MALIYEVPQVKYFIFRIIYILGRFKCTGIFKAVFSWHTYNTCTFKCCPLVCLVTALSICPIWIVSSMTISLFQESKYFQMSYQDNRAKLLILEAYPEDEGVYSCTAMNVAGSVTTGCDLYVLGKFHLVIVIMYVWDAYQFIHYCALNNSDLKLKSNVIVFFDHKIWQYQD